MIAYSMHVWRRKFQKVPLYLAQKNEGTCLCIRTICQWLLVVLSVWLGCRRVANTGNFLVSPQWLHWPFEVSHVAVFKCSGPKFSRSSVPKSQSMLGKIQGSPTKLGVMIIHITAKIQGLGQGWVHPPPLLWWRVWSVCGNPYILCWFSLLQYSNQPLSLLPEWMQWLRRMSHSVPPISCAWTLNQLMLTRILN